MSSPDIKVLLGTEGVEQVIAAMRRVQKETKETGDAAKKSSGGFSSLKKLSSEFSSGVMPQLSALANPIAAIGAASAASAIALGALTVQAIDFADSLNDMSDRTGIGVETLSQLVPVAELGGTSLENLAAIFGKFSAKVAAGDSGIKSLGLQSKDAASAMIEIAGKIGEAKNQTEAIAIAQKAYGKQWQEMMPILKAGPEAIREQMSGAALVTAEMAKKSAELKDQMTTMKAPLMEIGLQLGSAIIPEITKWLEGVSIILAKTKELLGLSTGVRESLRGASDTAVENARLNKLKEIAEVQKQIAEKTRPGQRRTQDVTEEREKLDLLVKQSQEIDDIIAERKKLAATPAALNFGAGEKEKAKEWIVETNEDELAKRKQLADALQKTQENEAKRQEEIQLQKILKQEEATDKAARELADRQAALKQQFESGATNVLTTFLTDTIFNAKSASDAISQFGMSVVSTMQQIMTQMLVMQAVKAMFGAFGGGMGPGNVMAGSVIPSLGAATGGIIAGGTPGVDSVPVMTMPGEGILRTSAMSRIGAEAFHDLNSGRAFVVRGRSMPRFADGGIVGGAGASAVEGGFGEAGLTVGLADGLVEQKIERWARGPVARRIQVEQLSKAPKSANQALGRTK